MPKENKTVHLLMVPFTGLGLYQGYRGKKWLKNRILIFKQFVVPSLLNQSNKNFILWFAWRYEERQNAQVQGLKKHIDGLGFRNVFTYSGIPFWDDKYPDEIAKKRLVESIHGVMGDLLNISGDAETILMTIQPSDDCYHKGMVEEVQNIFKTQPNIQAVAYQKGYVMDYINHRLSEWNPSTNPPFFTVKFSKEVFIDPFRHIEYAGYKSHEHIGDFFKVLPIYERGFLVGTHGENISTQFNHPFTGQEFFGEVKGSILADFGLDKTPPLEIKTPIRKMIMKRLPHGWQKKLRYWLGERFYSKFYDFIRS